MPPVRWKLHAQVTLLILLLKFSKSDLLQDSGTVDGWRPIIGKSHRDVEDAITIYKNPSQSDSESKPIKAETLSHHTPPPTLSTKPYQTISTSEAIAAALISNNPNNKLGKKIHGSKTAPILKIQQPIVIIPKYNNHGHGPHIPLSSGSQRRHPVIAHNNHKGKRPTNTVRGSPSLKNEIFIPASSTSAGSFAIFNQPHGPHRLRDNQNVPGGKHFHLASHQFGNHFSLGGNQGNNDVVIQQVPVRTLLIQNQQSNQNEANTFIKSDDFNKNLVPPPYSYIQQNNAKPTDFPPNELGDFTEKATYHNAKLVGNKYKDRRVPHPESLISHVPSHFNEKHNFNFHGNDESEVQITKEKIKSLHNSIPISYQSTEEENEPYQFQHNGKPNENVRTHHVSESYSSINNYNHEPNYKNKNQVRESFIRYEEPKEDRYKKPISVAPSNPTYEVTEGKHWQIYQPFLSTRPTLYKPLYSQLAPTVQVQEQAEQEYKQHTFLPTPYNPENSVQNSPSLDDISSIYSELNKKKVHQHQEYVSEQPEYFNYREGPELNKYKPIKNEEYATEQPDFFNLREVSTHYPIITKSEYPTVTSIPDGIQSTEYIHEQTTLRSHSERHRPVQNYPSEEEVEVTKPPPSRKPQDYRSRKPIRRRKPQSNRSTTASTTTSTTEEVPAETVSFDLRKAEPSNDNNYSNDLQKIKRTRKPGRVKTTQTPILETTPKFEYTTKLTHVIKQKHKSKYENNPIKVITEKYEIEEELPFNHRNPQDVSYSEEITPSVQTYQDSAVNDNNNYRYQPTTEDYPITFESELINPKLKPDNSLETEDYFKVSPTSNHVPEETQDVNSKYIVQQAQPYTENYEIQERPTQRRKRIRHPTTSTTTEQQPTIYTLTPENELDFVYSTQTNQFESAKEFTSTQEIPTKLISNHRSKPTILTTTASPTQPPSPTTITTPKAIETSTKSNRVRGRPTSKYDNKNRPRFSVKEYRDRLNQYSSTSSTESSKITTEASRVRFPNRSRKTSTTVQDDEPTTEKTKFTPKEPRYNTETTPLDKKISTRVRVLNNRRSTTEASTTQRVSIKPNIFSNLKRPSPITLKTRIQNKYNRTNTEEKVTEKPTTTYEASTDNTIPIDLETEPSIRQVSLSEKHDVDITNDDESEEMENDVLLLSQRISNLTSSAQNEYDTPGLFKAVSPNSRIVPSYFTISTDDPILPLEAFFPSIKEKMNKNDDN